MTKEKKKKRREEDEDTGSSVRDYGAFTPEDAEAAEQEMTRRGGNFIKIEPNSSVLLRILPGEKGSKRPWKAQHQHRVTVPGLGDVQFNCPRLMAKEKCATCKKAEKLFQSSSKRDKKLAKSLFPRRRCLAHVIDRANPDVVRVWGFGPMVEQQLIDLAKEGVELVHPTRGIDIKVKRTGEKLLTKYKVIPRSESAIADSDEALEELMDSRPDLSRYLEVLTAEEIEEKLSGEDSSDDDDDEDRPRRKASRSVADDDEDDSEDDED